MRFTLAVLSFTLIFSLSAAQEIPSCSRMKAARDFLQNPRQLSRNQADFDVKYYDLFLQLFPDSETVDGSAGVLVESLIDGLPDITLDLAYGMTVESVTDTNGNDLVFSHNYADQLIITLPAAINTGETFEAVIYYNGAPAATGFGSFGFDSYSGQDMIWSLSEPYGARDWWPCKDTPDDKADSVDISIKVPSNLIVASNGLLVDTITEDSWTTYNWQERYPIATYLVSVAIYPYTVFYDWFTYGESDSMRLDYYVYPNHYNLVQYNYGQTKNMLAGFSDRFGLFPFIDEKYGHAEFVWGGGMEHQTITSLGGYSQFLISHELAHSWWGDMVTCANFHHIWLNEGFATYGQAMWEEIKDGDIQSLHNEMWGKRYLGAGTIYVSDTTDVGTIFNGNLSYNKASWVLHMLRHMVGDSLFFAGLQEYRSRFAFSTVVTEDFRDTMEDITGRDLHHYFERWIYGEYYPIYQSAPSYYSSTNGSNLVRVVISQGQESPPFWMPIDIRIVSTAGVEYNFIAENTEDGQEFYFVVDGTPDYLLLDPDDWILKEALNGSMQFNGEILAGDLNQDGVLDILDVVSTVDTILNPETAAALENWIGDVNSDGILDILDLVLMVSWIIG
ncbi:MAG: peptidase M1 [FCB group bacterium]|nr:peptidase M1 [FCB group bacterium]